MFIVSALIFRFVPKLLGKNSSAQLYGIIWLSILIKLWISINKIYCELGWNILPQWSYSISAPSVLQPGVKYLHICDQGSHSGASEDWWLHDLVYCICTLGLTNWARRKRMNIELMISYLFKILRWKMVTLIIASVKQFLIFANLYANINNMYGGIPANWSIDASPT